MTNKHDLHTTLFGYKGTECHKCNKYWKTEKPNNIRSICKGEK